MTEKEPDASELYEFDAPSHVVDFMVNAETDDKWFDERASVQDVNLVTPLKAAPPQAKGPQTDVVPQTVPDCSSGPPSNIVTSWGPETRKTFKARRTVKEPPAQPSRVLKRKSTSTTQKAPAPKRPKETKTAPKDCRAQPSDGRRTRLNALAAQDGAAPCTTKAELVSSEELEMERIKNLQREVALHRMQNEASYKAALAGGPPPKKEVLSTTVPKDFHFSTDSRIKAAASSQAASREVDFPQQLRRPASPAKTRRGVTTPKPFNLSAGNKKKDESAAYVPMAQQIQEFQKKTPLRYHMHSRRILDKVKAAHLKLTQPHSPHLMTRRRGRATAVKSSAELEEEEAERQKKFRIKALELNKKILEGAEELKKPPVKEPTIPEGFELEIERRLQERQATRKTQEMEEQAHSFKANPLPKKVLDGVVGLPEKKVLHPTVPESPAFALKKRVRLNRKAEEVKQPSPVKAPPVPHFGLPFQPRLPEDHHVEVCPFSFEERERERRALKEKRLEELRNEEVPQFKAQLLPHFDTVVLPEKKKLEPTKPEPFRLLIDERGAAKSSRWEQMVKEEQKQQEEAAVFKARPNTVTHKEPFRPKKESRPALVVETFELATERRAREWQEYERVISEKEALSARLEAEQRREEEQRLREEIAMLRQEQVHKAQPIRQYKPVMVKKSEIPLTVPASPNFSDRFRL